MVLGILVSLYIPPVRSAIPAMDTADSAKAIALRLQEHYRHAQSLRAVFLERYSEGPREARIESGTVYFRRPGRMRWEYEAPEKKLFIADGKTVWFYVPADRSVTRAPVKESSDWRTPLSLLTGKADLSKLCGRIDLVMQKGTPTGHVVLRCLPRGEKVEGHTGGNSASGDSTELPGAGDFTEVFLEVDSASGELASVRIRQAGGIELEYRFGGWQEGLPLSDEIFRFNAPAGVAIVDGSAPVNSTP
jgi:outer membrane lipoprotein carrier protein